MLHRPTSSENRQGRPPVIRNGEGGRRFVLAPAERSAVCGLLADLLLALPNVGLVVSQSAGNDKFEDNFNTETHRNLERFGEAKATV